MLLCWRAGNTDYWQAVDPVPFVPNGGCAPLGKIVGAFLEGASAPKRALLHCRSKRDPQRQRIRP